MGIVEEFDQSHARDEVEADMQPCVIQGKNMIPSASFFPGPEIPAEGFMGARADDLVWTLCGWLNSTVSATYIVVSAISEVAKLTNSHSFPQVVGMCRSQGL